MKKKRVLFISQEIMPYLPETEMSKIGRELPQGIQEKGKEIRVFTPKYGLINERRNQLHEVIRLSGMNLIINDTDHPLIIKVASIQSAKMQVYFIDNEEFFRRKFMFEDENNEPFADNDERSIFFARGVIETIKKLRWAPDVIHCQGWLANMVPLYIKKSYQSDPLFQQAKIVYSVYDDEFNTLLDANYKEKAMFQGVEESDMKHLADPSFVNIYKHGIEHSDAVIYGSEKIHPEIDQFVKNSNKKLLEFQPEDALIDAYSDFYDSI